MEYSEKVQRIKEWKKTSEYEVQYSLYHSLVEDIVSTAEQYRSTFYNSAIAIDERTIRTEVASKSDLHRGYYCPSLTYDLVVGGVKRGKLLRRFTKNSKTYFQYGFDKDEHLIWSKHFFNNEHVKTEYLVYTDERVLGLTFCANGNIEAITEERYYNGKLQSYCYVLMLPKKECTEWVEMRKEEYTYDNEGLKSCDWYSIFPFIHSLKHERITFERDDGFLSKHYWETLIGLETEQVVYRSDVYDMLDKRKA